MKRFRNRTRGNYNTYLLSVCHCALLAYKVTLAHIENVCMRAYLLMLFNRNHFAEKTVIDIYRKLVLYV